MSRSGSTAQPLLFGLCLLTAVWIAGAGEWSAATLDRINRERRNLGISSLRASAELDRAAQWKADALAEEASLFPSSRPELITARADLEDLPELLTRAGFEAARVKAHVVVADRALDSEDLWQSSDSLRRDLLDGRFRQFGLGWARAEPLEIAVLIPALSQEDDFAERTRDLDDLEAVRRELLRRSNEARRVNRRRPLRRDGCLERVAQEYAEAMLAGGFYGHHSPDGKDVAARIRALGCADRRMAENLARGQVSAAEVIDGWLDSPGHRRNLLSADYDRVGHGLAQARIEGVGWILWVQVFAAAN